MRNNFKILIIIGILSTIILFSCENDAKIKNNMHQLEQRRTEIKNELYFLTVKYDSLQYKIDSLSEKLKELTILNNGNTPTYIVKLEIRQYHLSLSVFEHIKDGINKTYIEFPTNKEFYDSIKIGTVLNDSFRMGSFIINGSVGHWGIKVVDKKIE